MSGALLHAHRGGGAHTYSAEDIASPLKSWLSRLVYFLQRVAKAHLSVQIPVCMCRHSCLDWRLLEAITPRLLLFGSAGILCIAGAGRVLLPFTNFICPKDSICPQSKSSG